MPGGQVLRYALSSYFVFVGSEDLSSSELLLRGFTLVIATVVFLIFVVPVALGVLHYLVPIVRTYKSAFHDREAPAERTHSHDEPKGARSEARGPTVDSRVDAEAEWICPFCTEINAMDDELCALCEIPRLNDGLVVERSSEQKNTDDLDNSGTGEDAEDAKGSTESKLWRISRFDMNSFFVLCQLGSGVTCLVTLVRICSRSPRRRRVPGSGLSVLREEPDGFDKALDFVDDTGYESDSDRLKHRLPSISKPGSGLNSMRKSSSIAVGLGALPPAEDSSEGLDLASAEADVASQKLSSLNGSSSHGHGGGLKRVASSVPSELYMQGDGKPYVEHHSGI